MKVKPASTKGHNKAELRVGRAGAAVPPAAPHKDVPVHANLVQQRSAELINMARSHLTLLESPQGKHCLTMPEGCGRNSKGPRMGRETFGSTQRDTCDPSLC